MAAAKIMQPALFIAGTHDAVITGSMGSALDDGRRGAAPKRKILLEGGPLIQQSARRGDAV